MMMTLSSHNHVQTQKEREILSDQSTSSSRQQVFVLHNCISLTVARQ